jgi:hypothetical protein
MSDSESDFEASASDSDGYVEQAPPTPKVITTYTCFCVKDELNSMMLRI